MISEILTRPAYHPVTLAQAKLQSRVTVSDEDALFTGIIIPAAHRAATTELQRSIMLTTWLGVCDAFPRSRQISLPWPKLLSVSSVQYRDTAGALQTLDPAQYGVDLTQSIVYLKPSATWPATECTPGAVHITWKAGYNGSETGNANADEAAQQAAVPEDVKSWVLLRCAALYEFRELLVSGANVDELPLASGLLDGERRWAI